MELIAASKIHAGDTVLYELEPRVVDAAEAVGSRIRITVRLNGDHTVSFTERPDAGVIRL